MVSAEQCIACVIEAQSDGLRTYIGNLVELKDALNEIIAIEEDDGTLGTIEAMKLYRIRAEMEQQLDCSKIILDELEQLKWTVVPLAPPPALYE